MDIKKVQNRLLEMAIAIRDVLEKNNIPYYIIYGTLLGSVRHKGFIPWDDDFDFYIMDKDYDKAIGLLRAELPQNMFVEDEESEPLYFHGWARIKDLNTVCTYDEFPQDGLYKHLGICVDLFRAYKCQLSELCDLLNGEFDKYLERREIKNTISTQDLIVKRAQLQNIKQSGNMYSGKTETVYSTLMDDNLKYITEENLFPLKQYEFEGQLFWGPNNADAILSRLYGDYMQLPNVEDRVAHYSSVEFTNK